MKRLLIVLVASLVLGLVGGVGSALASDLLPPPPNGTDTVSQTATQSNDGSNTANQSGVSAPVITSGPNIAVANGSSSCDPCGDSGTTNQNSGNNVDASNTNTATQTNNQANGAGQTQTADQGSSGSASQSADQSNTGENSAYQSGTSTPVVVSGPNVAVLNSGDVNQNSGNNVDASNENNATQTNHQSNAAGQSQTVDGNNGCCSSSEGASQSASQSNEGSNYAHQSGTSTPVVVSGGNYAILNKDDVSQNSGNNVDASNANNARQTNNQSNSAGQSQTVADGGSCCSSNSGASQSADQSNSGSNSTYQSGTSAPVVVSGPNFAIANGWGHDPCCGGGGTVNQNSGNNVDASNHNNATQVNNQGNGLGQTQTVSDTPWGCCSAGGDVTQSAHQSNDGSNSVDQTGYSSPVVTSGKNVAFLNGGDVNQNSGNNVDASNHNNATQVNNQSNSLSQRQSVDRGTGCPTRCELRCEPNPCPPPPCEPNPCPPPPCEPRCDPCDNHETSIPVRKLGGGCS
jgi:hypothetical protein